MRAALGRVDVVGEAEHVLDEALVVLQGHLDGGAVDLAFDVDRGRVYNTFAVVQMLDEGDDPALEVERVRVARLLIVEDDLEALIEEGHLPQPVPDQLAVEGCIREHLVVRPEADDGASVGALADGLHGRLRDAPHVALGVLLAVAVDIRLEALAQRIDDREAHAMETAGDLVAATTELAAGVEHGEHNLERAAAVLLFVDGNAATVVLDGNAAVEVKRHQDLRAVAGQRFVDGVVDQLPDQVVEALVVGRPDVHARTPPDRFEAFEDLNLLGGVSHVGAYRSGSDAAAGRGAREAIRVVHRGLIHGRLLRPTAERACRSKT